MSTDIVVVACKLPAGLILEVGVVGEENYRRMQVAGPKSHLRDGSNNGIQVGGYAFTNIPKDLWDEFYKNHRTAPYLKNRAVFVEDSLEKAHAAALSDRRIITGFERLDPDKPADGLVPDAEHLRVAKANAPKLNKGLAE